MSRLLRLYLGDEGNGPKFSSTVPVHMVNEKGLGEVAMWLLQRMNESKREKKARGRPFEFPSQDGQRD